MSKTSNRPSPFKSPASSVPAHLWQHHISFRYYVDTVGKNARKIAEYIQNQLKEDALSDQLTLDLSDPFTGSK